ncbi:MAG TPA: hypothetical protein VH502_12425 [Actinoplanes sp.]|jgi:hypothetical protein
MTDRDEGLPALGTPDEQPAPEGDDDFAGEHDATAVDQDVTAGRDVGETESPDGWSGLDREPLP